MFIVTLATKKGQLVVTENFKLLKKVFLTGNYLGALASDDGDPNENLTRQKV